MPKVLVAPSAVIKITSGIFSASESDARAGSSSQSDTGSDVQFYAEAGSPPKLSLCVSYHFPRLPTWL